MVNQLTLKSLVLLAATALFLTGCDLYDLDAQPSTALSPEIALEDISGYEALLNSVYNRAQGEEVQGYQFVIAPDVLADGAYLQDDPSGRFVSTIENAPGAHISATPSGSNTYFTIYRLINEANHIIANVHEAQGATDAVVNRMRGEAFFMRALHYHDAARIYGYEPGREVDGWDQSVIIRTEPTTDLGDVEFSSRDSNIDVYNQIESDIQEALNLLAPDDRGTYYANYAAAHALAARVYLYWERWDDAEHHATRAMEESGIGLASYDEVQGNMFDQTPNPESIFELQYHVNESLGVNYSAAAVLTPAQWYDILPAPEVIDLYEEGDARLEGFYAEADEGYEWDTYTIKYNQTEGSGTFADNVPIFRYAEMLLLRAEARAEQGDFAGAQEDLNELQEARGMQNLSSFGDLDGAIDAIFEERRRELGFEGHRWFDLKRRGMDVPKAEHQTTPTVPYTDYRILSPLPDSQVDNNPQLQNNPGY